MFDLDPVKLLLIGAVALAVLGPDKLPAAARKASSLVNDLRRLHSSLDTQVREAVGDHPVVTELTEMRETLRGLHGGGVPPGSDRPDLPDRTVTTARMHADRPDAAPAPSRPGTPIPPLADPSQN